MVTARSAFGGTLITALGVGAGYAFDQWMGSVPASSTVQYFNEFSRILGHIGFGVATASGIISGIYHTFLGPTSNPPPPMPAQQGPTYNVRVSGRGRVGRIGP